ncbi:MAG: DUF1385 domain-containing protein [Oscillospiraceae bacterium]|nr:DUF1385 domain-containing protein [Oscillospiraceae bacterium]
MSENNSNNSRCPFRTSIGGQALIEGVMMRGPQKQAIAVRRPDGEIELKVTELQLIKDKYPILGIPIVRGVANFISSMVNGVRAITYSASFLPEEEQEEPSKFDIWIEKKLGSEKAEKVITGFAVFLGIVLAVALFFMLPTVITGFAGRAVESRALLNIIEGAVRIAIFLGYMILVSRMKDIKRIWQYHGAEHKTIFCYENRLPLTPENAAKQSRFHPRCGTSFLFLVMIISIIVFSVVSWSNVLIRLLLRLVLLPVVVGISYELIKLAGRYDNIVTRIISAPGKALQRITTAEPDESMLEVAIASMKAVIPEEEGSDIW